MSEGHNTEVGTKLVLDDHATAALHRVGQGFEKISEHVHHAQGELGGFARQAIATAAGFQLSGAIESIKELGMEGFKAAAANEEQIKGLAGLVAITDKVGLSYEQTLKQGEELKENLERISIAAGQNADALIDSFGMIAEKTTKTKEEVVELTEKLAFAARATRGGVEGLAGAFAQLEMGIIRPRNQLVMLMKQTGVVAGDAKKIAKSLTAMMAGGDEQKAKVFELAEQAVSRMADKMRNAPLTYAEIVKSLHTIRENIFEALGGPMVKALTPALDNLRRYLVENKHAIEAYAESMGVKVGDWIKSATESVADGFKYLQTHAQEIEAAIKSGAKTAKDVVEFILAHKEEIAIAYGVRTAAPMVGSAIDAGKTALSVGGMIGAGSSVGGIALGGGAVAAAAGLAALTAAIVAVGAAAYEAYLLSQEIPTQQDDINAKLEAFKRITEKDGLLDKGDLDDLARFRRELGEMSVEAGRAADAMWGARSNRQTDDARLNAEAAAGTPESMARLVAAYEGAVKTHDTYHQKFITSLMGQSTNLQSAFLNASDNIAGGFEHLIELLSLSQGAKSAAEFRRMHDLLKGNAKSQNVFNANFSGNITVNQDFRDADPDRVAIILRQDLVKQAESRRQGMMGMAFGF